MNIDKSTIKVYGTKAQQTKAVKLVQQSKQVATWFDGKFVTIAACYTDEGQPTLETEALIVRQELALSVEFKAR